MCRIGDAVRMAVATASAASEHPPGSDVAIRSKIQKSSPILPISPRGKPMCMRWHLRNAQSSSTQTIIGNLSATTLSLSNVPVHRHAPGNGGGFISGGGDPTNITYGGGAYRVTTYTDYQGNSGSHTHSITNPSHNHSATSSKITLLPLARAFYYIMRVA